MATHRIAGTVTSGTDPVPGANIVVKGTATGTSTDANGAFTLTLRGAADVITVSAIGYKAKDVTVGNQTAFNITLEEESSTLNEVVVTGYSADYSGLWCSPNLGQVLGQFKLVLLGSRMVLFSLSIPSIYHTAGV